MELVRPNEPDPNQKDLTRIISYLPNCNLFTLKKHGGSNLAAVKNQDGFSRSDVKSYLDLTEDDFFYEFGSFKNKNRRTLIRKQKVKRKCETFEKQLISNIFSNL